MNASSPVSEYSCLSDVISETRDVYVVDLVRFTVRLSTEYAGCLEPAPNGVYMRGSLEPIMVFGGHKKYFTAEQWKADRAIPNVNSFQDFISSLSPVVDEIGRVVCSSPRQMQQYFQDHCSFNYTAVHLAAVSVWNILRSLHADTRPCTQMPREWLDERNYVLPETLNAYYAGRLPDLDDLIDQVLNFVGRDHCAIYTMDLQNTTLRIGKGNDFRVIAYYRQIFERHEAERFETLGY